MGYLGRTAVNEITGVLRRAYVIACEKPECKEKGLAAMGPNGKDERKAS